jgi:hypothetical protein
MRTTATTTNVSRMSGRFNESARAISDVAPQVDRNLASSQQARAIGESHLSIRLKVSVSSHSEVVPQATTAGC